MRTREARRPELARFPDPGKGQVGRLDYLGLPGVLQCKGATARPREVARPVPGTCSAPRLAHPVLAGPGC